MLDVQFRYLLDRFFFQLIYGQLEWPSWPDQTGCHKFELAQAPFRLVLHTELGCELREGLLLPKLHVGLAWFSCSIPCCLLFDGDRFRWWLYFAKSQLPASVVHFLCSFSLWAIPKDNQSLYLHLVVSFNASLHLSWQNLTLSLSVWIVNTYCVRYIACCNNSWQWYLPELSQRWGV